MPTSSIVGMLTYFGIRANGTLAATILKLLTDLRLVTCTSDRYTTGQCRLWCVTGAAARLPFVARLELKPAGAEKTVVDDQASRYVAARASGGRQDMGNLIPFQNSIRDTSGAPQLEPTLLGDIRKRFYTVQAADRAKNRHLVMI